MRYKRQLKKTTMGVHVPSLGADGSAPNTQNLSGQVLWDQSGTLACGPYGLMTLEPASGARDQNEVHSDP